MAQGFDPSKAALFNKLIQEGLTEDAALAQAGISSADFGNYELNDKGQLGQIVIGPGQQPGVQNVTNKREEVPISSERPLSTTTTEQITVTGGSVETRTVIPTTFKDTEESKQLQSQANSIQAQKDALAAELRAQGKSGAQIVNNPEFRKLSREAREAEYAAENAKQVDVAGRVVTTTEPGSGTVFEQTVDSDFQTNKSSGDDSQANLQEINSLSAAGTPARDISPVNPDVDPQTGADESPTVPPADVRDQAEIPTNTSGYGEEINLAVPTADVRTAPSIIGDEDAQQAAFQTFAAAGDEDAQDAAFGVFNSQNRVQVGVKQANNQPNNRALAQFPVNTDWRVVLRLAPGADYLYAAPDAGLLQPLKTTNGVVFPYTPSITTAYKANYSEYNLTHSNYRGYFYQNSYTDTVQLNATFTAQSTADAAYVLAVIHFFRSVTKMFYGNDAQRGSPPPLVYLSGLGDYQFNNHPCLVSQFNYSLPADVDYISSGSPNNLGLNLQPLQNLYSTTLNAVAPTVTRLATAFLPRGAENERSAPLQALLNNPTYVPSKIDIQLSLLPTQSRSAVSKQFSLKNFANGNLLKGGFW